MYRALAESRPQRQPHDRGTGHRLLEYKNPYDAPVSLSLKPPPSLFSSRRVQSLARIGCPRPLLYLQCLNHSLASCRWCNLRGRHIRSQLSSSMLITECVTLRSLSFIHMSSVDLY